MNKIVKKPRLKLPQEYHSQTLKLETVFAQPFESTSKRILTISMHINDQMEVKYKAEIALPELNLK